MIEFNDTSIRLISGEPFDYLDPDAHEITIHDVAHALARVSRYGGHNLYEWTVAHHTCLVANIVGAIYHEPGLVLAALHHDDVEAFTGDWTSPMKVACQRLGLDYVRALERPIESALCRQLGLVMDDLHAGPVKDADRLALVAEQTVFKPGYVLAEQDPDVDADMVQRCMPCLLMLADCAAGPNEIEMIWQTLHCRLAAAEGRRPTID